MSTAPRAVLLAGGKGTRLAPFTATFPKPLVPIGDAPILEVVLRQLKSHGVQRVTLAVNHLASLIEAFFGDGANLGLAIDYSLEEKPLGTAGPLSLVDGLDSSFFVLNGDLLCDLDFSAMLARHRESGAMVTVGLYSRRHTVEFGVVEVDQFQCLTGYAEKPSFDYLVSTGVYVMEPAVLDFIEVGEHVDLPDLVHRLIDSGLKVHSYLHEGYWLDIGRPEDYRQAQDDFPALRARLFGEA